MLGSNPRDTGTWLARIQSSDFVFRISRSLDKTTGKEIQECVIDKDRFASKNDKELAIFLGNMRRAYYLADKNPTILNAIQKLNKLVGLAE